MAASAIVSGFVVVDDDNDDNEDDDDAKEKAAVVEPNDSSSAAGDSDNNDDGAKNNEASSISLSLSDLELNHVDEDGDNDDDENEGAEKPERSLRQTLERKNSNLRSSLLKNGKRSSQKSLRLSKQLAVASFDVEDLAKSGDDEDGKQNVEEERPASWNSVNRTSLVGSDLHDAAAAATDDDDDDDDDSRGATAPNKRTVKTVASQTNQVFFMIGCQRSGSNWLRTMLSEREDLIAPHPPHIMRDFMPRLGRYGDLTEQRNLRILIDHVCAFVERNQVKWLDLHSRPMMFKRSAILMEVMVTIECFKFKEKYTAMQEGKEPSDEVDNPYYLLATFDAIMNAMTKANGKKIWMCKSMGMSQFHDLLLSFYGKERLRYIYLVRDPRDVCLSFMNTPVGDCHPYSIAKKWAKLQNFAAIILHDAPDLIHQVCYEEVLGNKEAQVAKIIEFMGARDVCRSMRRGSIVAIKSEKEVVSGAKSGREAKMAGKLSYQFKNLSRGDSFIAGQFRKWAKEMKEDDLLLVESVAFEDMQRLGYEPHLVRTQEDRIFFTKELVEKYEAENKRLIDKMNADLAITDPEDLERRQIQAAVLEKTISEHYDEEVVNSFGIDVDHALDNVDEVQKEKGFLRSSSGIASFDFCQWPLRASMVGFQPGLEVKERFELQETQKLRLKGGISLSFAAASQGGYYPSEKDKANQDAFIAGARVCKASRSSIWKKEEESGILFAVFDGHGPNGTECARWAKEHVMQYFVETINADPMSSALDHDTIDESTRISSSFSSAYRRSSSLLENGEEGIDASHSGTTATSLFITNDYLHTANVGDSRCLLIKQDQQGKTSVDALTMDHTPDREDEIMRIEAHGGVVMSSEQYDVKDPTYVTSEQKRIWSKAGKWPGTAFTRSIGDAVAKQLGVCADPECAHFPIPTSDAMIVLGSDGIFDFIPNDEIGAIVKKYDDPAKACRELIGKAWNRWCDSEERTDDITVIVVDIVPPQTTN